MRFTCRFLIKWDNSKIDEFKNILADNKEYINILIN